MEKKTLSDSCYGLLQMKIMERYADRNSSSEKMASDNSKALIALLIYNSEILVVRACLKLLMATFLEPKT